MKYIIVVLLSAAFALLMAQTAPALTDRVVAQETPVASKNVKAEAQAPLQPKPEKKKATVKETHVKPAQVSKPKPKTPVTNHEQLLETAGVPSQDWPAADFIFTHESSWRPTVLNSEGCVGLGQRCPASVLLSDCPNLSEVCQIKHFTKYAVARYGSWWGAYNFWKANSWW